jgi:hypothetical protein
VSPCADRLQVLIPYDRREALTVPQAARMRSRRESISSERCSDHRRTPAIKGGYRRTISSNTKESARDNVPSTRRFPMEILVCLLAFSTPR